MAETNPLQEAGSQAPAAAVAVTDFDSLLRKEFKPKTDDMREAPSRTLMEALWQAGAKVQAFDPVAMPETARIYPEHPMLALCADKYAALTGTDALVICTEWQQFRAPDFDEMELRMPGKLIVDGRNLYQPAKMQAGGWSYMSVGRAAVMA